MHNTIVPMEQRNLSIFTGGPAASATAGGDYTYYTWTKPADSAFVWMMIISSGGFGGGGGSGTTASVRLGGYGGAQSPVFTGLYPSHMVPDILYVKVSCETYPTVAASVYYTGVYVDSNCTFAFAHTLGGAGTIGTTPGTLNLAPVVGASNTGYQHSGIYSNTVPSAPTSTSKSITSSITGSGSQGGGAGLSGSGTSFPGTDLPPSYANAVFIPTILAGTSPLAANTNGGNGIFNMKPFFSTGGAGGYGYSNSTPAGSSSGIGGKGGFGSGGGGGGATNSSNPTGGGGNGGPGIVIIKTF